MTKDMYKADGIQTMIPTKPPERENGFQAPVPDVKETIPGYQDDNTYRKPPLYEPELSHELPRENEYTSTVQQGVGNNIHQNNPQMFQQNPQNYINHEIPQQMPRQNIDHRKGSGIGDILKKLFSNLKGKSLAEKMEGMRDEPRYQPTYQQTFNAHAMPQEHRPTNENSIRLEDINSIVEKRVTEAVRNSGIQNQQVHPGIEIENLKTDIDGTAQKFADIEKKISNLSTTMQTFEGSSFGIDEKGNELEEKLSRGFESSKERMNIIEDRIAYFETSINSIHSENDDLKRSLTNIESNISELTGSYSTLLTIIEDSTTATDSRMTELSEKVERMAILEPRLTGIEEDLLVSRQSISDIGQTISAIMGDIAENYSSTETIRSETRDDLETIQDKVESVTKYVEEELKKVGARGYNSGNSDVQLTYIEKNTSSMKICMEWLEMLMELVGRNNLSDLLSYYEELGWISEEISFELLRYADGIDYYLEKPDWKLNPSDHVKSIWFIEKLAGTKVDKNKLTIIDKDIEKVKKGTEQIYSI